MGTKFTSSGSRFKRQNDNNNNIVAPAGADVQIDQQSSSSSVTASSARDVPTTCTSLLKLMDDITETLTNNPAGVTPLMTLRKMRKNLRRKMRKRMKRKMRR